MTISITELARAREISSGLLDELGLDAYLFEIEPRDGQWQLKVDCAMEEGAWESVTLMLPWEPLLASEDDDSVRLRVLSDLRSRLAACKRQMP